MRSVTVLMIQFNINWTHLKQKLEVDFSWETIHRIAFDQHFSNEILTTLIKFCFSFRFSNFNQQKSSSASHDWRPLVMIFIKKCIFLISRDTDEHCIVRLDVLAGFLVKVCLSHCHWQHETYSD